MLYARRYYNEVRRRKETSERADNMRAATPVWETGRKVQLQVVKLLYNCAGKVRSSTPPVSFAGNDCPAL